MEDTAPLPPSDAATLRPSGSLVEQLVTELRRHPPFSEMDTTHVAWFVTRASQAYFAPDEALVRPADGPVRQLFYIRSGSVVGERGLSDASGGAFQYEAGDLFPVSAALAQRAPTTTYRAGGDTFVLALPLADMRELAESCPVFGDFLNRRILRFLEMSRAALQVAYSSQALAEQSLETRLAELAPRPPVTCRPDTPLQDVLATMHQRRIGSMLVTDAGGVPLGIFTRYDVLGRVTLPQVPLQTPIEAVMVQPVFSLSEDHTAQDAALLMSQHGIRHVPITRGGVAVGMVSERDLFAMQRLSLKQVSSSIRGATDVATLRLVAHDIRRFARSLLGQGVQARQLTGLVSHLNDVLTQRLVELLATQHGVDLGRICWIALGSEGRSEQTVATDQDNALILDDSFGEDDKPALLSFAREVNEALDACGYPLCRGNIMASNPACCLTLRQWRERFAHWIEHGAPQDLLNASIYFDFRALAGAGALAQRLRDEVTAHASRVPRFLQQLALNALQQAAPLNWLGNIDSTEVDGRASIDLKLQGTALFVDMARLYALAHGVVETGTRARLEAVGQRLGVAEPEYQAWAGAFEFLQMLRLRAQLDGTTLGGNANRIAIDALNGIDRRILKESFRVARQLQQRARLDYER